MWIARTRLSDGLGAQLFQLAALTGYCERSGKHVPVVYDSDIDASAHAVAPVALAMFPAVVHIRARPSAAHAQCERHIDETTPFAFEPIPDCASNVLITGRRHCVGYASKPDGSLCAPDIHALHARRRHMPELFPTVDFAHAAFIHVRRNRHGLSPSQLLVYYEACMVDVIVRHASLTALVLLADDLAWAGAHLTSRLQVINTALSRRVQLVCEPTMDTLTDVECLCTMRACAYGGICNGSSALAWWGTYFAHAHHGASSYFPSQWTSAVHQTLDFPPWATVFSVQTGMSRTVEWLNTRIHALQHFEQDQLTGISACADWFVHKQSVLKKHAHEPPRTIFVNTRSASITFPFFVDHVLPLLLHPTVIILAGEDVTFPAGTGDVRPYMTPFAHMQEHVLALIRCPFVARVHVENLDWTGHPKLVPLPLGVLPYDPDMRFADAIGIRDERRPARVFCAHRYHDGPQWADRRRVSELCTGPWAAFTTWAPELSHADFSAALRAHDFVLCVHGGGLDPSPCAWEALLAGCIPIMARSCVSAAYAHFPCVIVDAWTQDALSPEKLDAWWEALRVHYESWPARRAILHKLTLEYWWTVISAPPVFATRLPALDEFVFFAQQDVIGHDMCRRSTNVLENALLASADPACVGFNTLGFMKHTADALSASAYMTAPHMGVFLKMSALKSLMQ
jgi:hypothetical protein